MFNYNDLRTTSTGLISNFGAATVLQRISGDVFDPATGEYTGGSTVTITGKGVRMMFAKSEINGETIQANDVRLYFQAGNGVPQIDDNCLFDGANYRVMNVMANSPSGTDLFYELQLRY